MSKRQPGLLAAFVIICEGRAEVLVGAPDGIVSSSDFGTRVKGASK